MVGPSDGGANLRVALICMPFASAEMPSIQIGLLTSIVKCAGFAVDGFYFNLDLAAQLGSKRYEWLCQQRGQMTGEWLFSAAAFGEDRPAHSDGYLEDFPDEAWWLDADGREVGDDTSARELRALRSDVLPSYLDRCADSVDWSAYQVVGFTATFQQTVASLAMATRIKRASPDTIVVFGGANMEGSMGGEHLRAFPVIDYVVVGEGDLVFPQMLTALVEGRPVALEGVLGRKPGEAARGQAAPVRDLDALPTPDYHDFYRRAQEVGLRPVERLPIEGSRGCWWGQKHHCTFCGLNGDGMMYRHKSSNRLLTEITELSDAHDVRAFDAVDNILFPQHLSGVFDVIADARIDYEFFFEVKSSVGRRDQLRRLRQGGVLSVQPGIESLSTHVLTLMDKGSTMLENVRLLKWARYYGIQVIWNLLWGFPGETIKDYQDQVNVMRLIPHLQPPSGGIKRIWLERFSPYFMNQDRYPLRNVRPLKSYGYVYPESVNNDELAYFFDYEMSDTVTAADVHEMGELVTDWRRRWAGGAPIDSLTFTRTSRALTVADQRHCETPVIYNFRDAAARVYESCVETHRSIGQIMTFLNSGSGKTKFIDTDVMAALEEFCDSGLMVAECGRYLSLALPANANW